MKSIFTIIVFLSFCAACACQSPPAIYKSQTPRIIIKEIPTDKKARQKEELFEMSCIYPDLTKGYIENQAFPLVPKVWLLAQGKKILLVGPETGPPEFNVNEIREFNLPPGRHILYIERWQNLSHYGGWRKIRKVEVINVSVAEFHRGRWRRWSNGHYGWRIVIKPGRSRVYSGYID